MNKYKICEVDADHLERGLSYLFKDNVNNKIRRRVRGLYFKCLNTQACLRKHAVSYALWEISGNIQDWASAMSVAYAKKGRKTK
ncbi:MAG: hypothetical protein WAV01_04580 [Candidatus Saccharimonadales bacterium]